MTRITRLALDNAAITLLLVVALIVAGATAARSLNQQLVPDIEPPQATIVVVYPGASADEVTRSVVEPVENALEQITELEVLAISSTASESFAAVTLQAEYGTDQDDIRAEIEDRLADVDLPEGAEEPDIFLFAFNDIPAIQVSVSGAIEEGDLQQLLEDEIVPELEAIDGVSRVSIAGQRDRKIFLDLDTDAMAAEGVTVADIRNLLQANDLSFPAGTLDAGGRVTPLQVTNEITDLDALENLVLKAGDSGGPAAVGGPPGARTAPQPPGPTAPPPPTVAEAPAALVDGPFPIPAELIAQARLIGLRISDTGDLTPELVEQLDDASPELLDRAARSIIDNLPSNAARDAIAADVITALPEDLQQAYEAATGGAREATAVAPTAATTASAPAGDGVTGRRIQVVIVRAGDTTDALAARYGTTQAAIEAENELEPGDDPVVGSIARIPLPEGDDLPLTWRLAGAETPAGITPDVYRRVAAAAPEALGQLTGEQLLALPPETIGSLPAAFLARQDDAVRDALVARREGRAPATQAAGEATTDRARASIPNVVRLADVATVRLVLDDASTINRTNGQNSLGLSVLKRQSANTVTVVRAVEDKIEELKDDLPAFNALEVNTVFEQASFIEESLNGVINEGVLGGVFAILAILLFLHFSVRSTAIISISIPLSVLTALLLMRLQGLSLNLLTLSGLTIAIGRVVDDSIVVVENIYRNLQNGMRKRDAVLQGTREVAAAITAATLITVAVFLPVGFIGGLTREFFLPLALTTSYALLASLVVAVTVVPLLAHYFLSAGSLPAPRETASQRAYTRVLDWALDHRVTTLVLSGLLFILSLGLLRFVPQTFIGGFGEPSLSVTLTMPPGTDLETTDAVALLVEDVLAADERLETIETTVGGGGAFLGQFAGNDPAKASLVATFADQDLGLFESLDENDEPVAVAEDVRAALARLNDADEIERRLRERMGEEDGLRLADNLRGVLADEAIERGQARAPFEFRVSSQASAGPPGGAFDLQVIGEDEAQVREATELIVAALRDPEEWEDEGYDVIAEVEDVDDEESFFDRLFGTDDEATKGEDDEEDIEALPIINVSSNLSEPRRLLAVAVDPAAAMDRGLTTAQVAFSLRPILEGENVGSVEIVGLDGQRQKIDVDVRYPDDLITDKVSLENYLLDNPSGDPVRLGDVADVALRDGAVQVTRIDGERAAIISGEVLDDDLFGITAAAMRIIERVQDDNRALFGDADDEDEDRPVVVRTGTASAEQQEGFGDLVGALPVSALIAYLVMVLEFGSLVVPFIILFSLPFAATGALFALVVTQRALSISSLIGMLLLIGIVVTNAIVLLDFVQRLRRQGLGAREALVEGGRTRLRPILMTAVATVLALIPLSLGLTEGALIASELATVVIGGMVSSTVLTLLVVPVVYSLLGDATRPTDAPRDEGPPAPPGAPSPAPPAGPAPAPDALVTTPPRTPGEAEWSTGTPAPPNPAAGPAAESEAPRAPGEESPFWD